MTGDKLMRLNIRISERDRERLEMVRTMHGVSISGIIRMSLEHTFSTFGIDKDPPEAE